MLDKFEIAATVLKMATAAKYLIITPCCEPDYCLDLNGHVTLPPGYVQDIPLARSNMDLHRVDDHGEQFLSLCRASGVRILNGRALGDCLGHCTCFSHNGQPSTIDYMLVCADFLEKVEYFHLHAPITDLSIHCLLSTNIKTKQYEPVFTSDCLNPLPIFFYLE